MSLAETVGAMKKLTMAIASAQGYEKTARYQLGGLLFQAAQRGTGTSAETYSEVAKQLGSDYSISSLQKHVVFHQLLAAYPLLLVCKSATFTFCTQYKRQLITYLEEENVESAIRGVRPKMEVESGGVLNLLPPQECNHDMDIEALMKVKVRGADNTLSEDTVAIQEREPVVYHQALEDFADMVDDASTFDVCMLVSGVDGVSVDDSGVQAEAAPPRTLRPKIKSTFRP